MTTVMRYAISESYGPKVPSLEEKLMAKLDEIADTVSKLEERISKLEQDDRGGTLIEELKPCPNSSCLSHAYNTAMGPKVKEMFDSETRSNYFIVWCRACLLRAPRSETYESAVQNWNIVAG